MIYKNYSLGYIEGMDVVMLSTYDMDIPKDASGEWMLAHTIKLEEVPGYQVENCREYLAPNGLFLGKFPPSFVEREVEKEHIHQQEARKRALEDAKQMCLYIWEDKDFEELNDGRNELSDILRLLNNVNRRRVEKYGLEAIDIDKEYGKYLKKYWGEEYGKE